MTLPDNIVMMPEIGEEEQKIENTLRPQTFDEYIGQPKIKQNLEIFVQAAKKRGESLEHVLLFGPPGLGKTTLAHVIAHHMGSPIRVLAGPAIERVGDLAAILSNLQEGEVLFIDEIHRMPRIVEETLYPAMEDYVLDVVVGKGPTAQTLRLNLPRFTLVGATTRPDMLSSPLRDRFGNVYRLEFYEQGDMEQIVERSAAILGIAADRGAVEEIAKRARSTPRIANRLLKRVRDYAEVKHEGKVTKEIAVAALDMLDVDPLGLDALDRKYLSTLIEKFNGGPAGLNTLASALSEEMATLEDMVEPFLLQHGFIERTPRGRTVTEEGKKHVRLH